MRLRFLGSPFEQVVSNPSVSPSQMSLPGNCFPAVESIRPSRCPKRLVRLPARRKNCDEAPADKDINAVLRAQRDLATVTRLRRPVLNYLALDIALPFGVKNGKWHSAGGWSPGPPTH